MSEFKPIETQEQFDSAIQDRIARTKKQFEGFMSPEDVAKKYEGYLSPDEVNKKYEGYMSPEDIEKKYAGYISAEDAAKKDAMIKQYESDSVKTRIAKEVGLPSEAVSFLKGESDEEIKKSAESLKNVFKVGRYPDRSNDKTQGSDNNKEAMKKMLRDLKGE